MISTYAGSGQRYNGGRCDVVWWVYDTQTDTSTGPTVTVNPNSSNFHYVSSGSYCESELMPLDYRNWFAWTPDYPPEKLMVRDYRTVLPVKCVIKQPIRNGFNRKGKI